MAFDFPANPTNGQTYQNYVYNSSITAWQQQGTPNNVGVQIANLETASPKTVASAAARDSLYPTPVQGQSVFRSDTGWEERYYALYNASTNPGGTTPAGWYPVSGNLPQGKLVRNSTAANFTAGSWNVASNLTYWATEIPATGGIAFNSNGTVSTTLPGFYEVIGGIKSAGVTFTILSIKKNSTSVDGAGQISVSTAYGLQGWAGNNNKSINKLAANDYIYWAYYCYNTTSSSYEWSPSDNGSFLHLRYVSPPFGA